MQYKEFLNKNDNYNLVMLPEHAGDDERSGLIEVPDGAFFALNTGITELQVNFYNLDLSKWYNRVSQAWFNSCAPELNKELPVLWQRYTQPESLPFVDDEPKTAWKKQEGGSHYKDLKIQPMQYALDNKLDYAQANVVKYVTRHANKNGKEDLLKAIHNIELMIEYYYGDKENNQ